MLYARQSIRFGARPPKHFQRLTAQETIMHVKKLMTTAGLACSFAGLVLAGAQAQGAAALTGQVTSAEEGPMEGVLVSAKKSGSTIAITVVSDKDGRYRFPAAKLDPGHYAIAIRAVGYDMDSPSEVDITSPK